MDQWFISKIKIGLAYFLRLPILTMFRSILLILCLNCVFWDAMAQVEFRTGSNSIQSSDGLRIFDVPENFRISSFKSFEIWFLLVI